VKSTSRETPRLRHEMFERTNGCTSVPQIFIGATYVAAATISLRSMTPVSSIRCSDQVTALHQATVRRHERGLPFHIQSRPRANAFGRRSAGELAKALAAIEDAKRAGAAYVLTPEMTNIIENKQARVPVRHDQPMKTATRRWRRCARPRDGLSIYVHIGSLAIKASPDRAANRSFLIDPRGNVVAALRQDPHVLMSTSRTAKAIANRQLSRGRTRPWSPICRGAGSV